jgi:hypothetical protein
MTSRERAVLYYAAAIGCLAFGVIGLASIGYPFVFAGIALLVVGPVRRRDVVWPPLVAIAAATLAFVLLAPTTCTASGGDGSCRNPLGFDLPGREITAIVIAIGLALAVGVALHLALQRRAT